FLYLHDALPILGSASSWIEFNDPVFVAEAVADLCKIDTVINKRSRSPTVQRDIRLSPHNRVGNTVGTILFFQEVSKLQDHIWLCGHHFLLYWREVVAWHDIPLPAGIRVFHVEYHISCLFHQHDAPGKPVTLLRPEQVAGIQNVAPGKQQLKGEKEHHKSRDKTRDVVRRAAIPNSGLQCGRPHPQYGSQSIKKPCVECRRKEDQRASDHNEREHPDGEQQPGDHVKANDRQVRPGPRARVEEEERNRKVVQGTHPAERIRGKLGGQQASYYRKVAVRRQPDAQRHSIEQPLRIKLGNAGVAINDSQLKLEDQQTPARYFPDRQ